MGKGRSSQEENVEKPCELRPGTANGQGREVQKQRGTQNEKKQNRKIQTTKERQKERKQSEQRGNVKRETK